MSPKKTSFTFQISWPQEKTFKLTITIPWSRVKKTYQSVLEAEGEKTKLAGFRKGKAPLDLIEKKVGKEKIYQGVIEKIVSQGYLEGVKKYSLSPIIDPKITLTAAKEGKDWRFEAVSCELPEVKLPNWKEEVQKINATAKIWTPEKGEKEPSREVKEREKQERWQKIIAKIITISQIEFPPLLIENEVEKKLASLIDQLQTAGLTLQQYLKTRGKTIAELKEDYRKEVKNSFKIELALEKIADEEKIEVEKEEIEAMTKRIQAQQKKKEKFPVNPYWVAQLIRREKTLAHLLDL